MSEEFKRLERTLISKGAIIDYYQDTMQIPNGNVVKWDLIDHKGAAAALPVREDGKIDISLQPLGFKVTDDLSEIIMDELHKNNGILRVSDRSDAGLIAEMFGCSKKSFKKSIGVLFKQRLIEIHEDYICLV